VISFKPVVVALFLISSQAIERTQ